MDRVYAIVLAGGSGSRMKSDTPKQYMVLREKPVLYYSLRTFSQLDYIDGVILVVSSNDDISYVKREIIDKYQVEKVKDITVGGEERYYSVYNGLKCIDEADYVMIHDSARCLIDTDTIDRVYEEVRRSNAVVAAVPVKDTIKRSDDKGYAAETLNRAQLWQIQTPQAFGFDLIMNAYRTMMADGNRTGITDDAMVVERYTDTKVKLVMGDYRNLKITTPEDMIIAETFLSVK